MRAPISTAGLSTSVHRSHERCDERRSDDLGANGFGHWGQRGERRWRGFDGGVTIGGGAAAELASGGGTDDSGSPAAVQSRSAVAAAVAAADASSGGTATVAKGGTRHLVAGGWPAAGWVDASLLASERAVGMPPI